MHGVLSVSRPQRQDKPCRVLRGIVESSCPADVGPGTRSRHRVLKAPPGFGAGSVGGTGGPPVRYFGGRVRCGSPRGEAVVDSPHRIGDHPIPCGVTVTIVPRSNRAVASGAYRMGAHSCGTDRRREAFNGPTAQMSGRHRGSRWERIGPRPMVRQQHQSNPGVLPPNRQPGRPVSCPLPWS